MPSAPTTSLDLGAADLVADPDPHFARERGLHQVAWHEPSGAWLTFSLRGFRRVVVAHLETPAGPREV